MYETDKESQKSVTKDFRLNTTSGFHRKILKKFKLIGMNNYFVVSPADPGPFRDTNSTGHFKVELPYPIELDPELEEIALISVTLKDVCKNIINQPGLAWVDNKGVARGWIYVPRLYYGNVRNQMRSIVQMIPKVNGTKILDVSTQVDEYGNTRVKLVLRSRFAQSIVMNSSFRKLLGFNQNQTFNDKNEMIAENSIDLPFEYTLNVYCSLVAPRLVNGEQTNLLHSFLVPVSPSDGSKIRQTKAVQFTNLRYLPVSRISQCQMIELLILDRDGQPIQCEDLSDITLELHIRRRRIF